MNQFAEKYKTLTNTDLLKIIENQGDYQQVAVEAAKAVLAERGLTPEELAEAMEASHILNQDKRLKENRKQILAVGLGAWPG